MECREYTLEEFTLYALERYLIMSSDLYYNDWKRVDKYLGHSEYTSDLTYDQQIWLALLVLEAESTEQ